MRFKNLTEVVALDIGTAKTTACVGGYDSFGRVEIIAAAMVKTRGFERGVITDIGEVARCIEEVISKIENKVHASGFEAKRATLVRKMNINSVYLTVGGEHISGSNTSGMLNLSERPIEIRQRDMQRVKDSVQFLSMTHEREILHILVQDYLVDGSTKTRDPRGIYGVRLGVNLHLLTGSSSWIKSLINATNRAGLDVEGVVFSGLATSAAALSEQEKEMGVVLLEMGAGATNILFFKEGSLHYTKVIAKGGLDITVELAQKLGIDFYQAEQLKMQYHGSFYDKQKDTNTDEDKIIIRKNSSNYQSINRRNVVGLIEAKLGEIINTVTTDLELAGLISKANCGLVVCGGMSCMEGIIEKLEEAMRLPVRLAILRGFVSRISGISNIFYATGMGLILQLLEPRLQSHRSNITEKSFLRLVMAKMRSVYEEYF